MMTGRTAAQFGLISEAVPMDRLDEVTEAIVMRLLANSALAMSYSKQALYIPFASDELGR